MNVVEIPVPQGWVAGDGGTAAQAPKRVLFVDDEVDVLDSLRDALRRYRRVWKMRFVTAPDLALAALESEPADVIVSDIQMPGMDGAELLALVQERYPPTIRIVLSGYANTELITRAATVAHRILAKPCSVEDLALVIERTCALHELTTKAEQFRAVASSATLPSCPGLYTEITRVLAQPGSGPADIAAVIECDIAMTAKLLQLANSAFFGVGRNVSRIRDAVVFLGADTIKTLTLSTQAFSQLAPRGLHGFSIDAFQRHAMLAARIAGVILPAGAAQQDAITAALLHDIGQLVAIADDRCGWQGLVEQARRRGVPLHVVEQERQGVTHAAMGAFLLSLWGLPESVVEAVAHHHDPSAVPGGSLDAVAAVHIADALAHEALAAVGEQPAAPVLDAGLIERLALSARLDQWRELAIGSVGDLAGGSASGRSG